MSTVKTSDVRPGEHVSTAPKPEPRALKEEIAWSRKAVEHLALLQQSTTQSPSPTAGQSPEEPKLRFEEAAIRPCTPEQQRMTDPPPGAKGGGNLRTIELTPGRFYARCMTVAWLINIAPTALKTRYAGASASSSQFRPDVFVRCGQRPQQLRKSARRSGVDIDRRLHDRSHNGRF